MDDRPELKIFFKYVPLDKVIAQQASKPSRFRDSDYEQDSTKDNTKTRPSIDPSFSFFGLNPDLKKNRAFIDSSASATVFKMNKKLNFAPQ